jgi:hypothetical protein
MDSTVSVCYDPVTHTVKVKAFDPNHNRGWQTATIPASNGVIVKTMETGDDKSKAAFLLQTANGMVLVRTL